MKAMHLDVQPTVVTADPIPVVPVVLLPITIKGVIKDYAKEKKFDYILGTGEVSTVLYGKEETDLTEIMIKNIRLCLCNNFINVAFS